MVKKYKNHILCVAGARLRPSRRQAVDAADSARQGRHPPRAQRVQELRDGGARGQQAPHQVPTPHTSHPITHT